VLPGTAPETLLGEMRALLGDGVTLEVLQQEPASESPWDDPLFDALVRHLTAGRTDVVAGPAISPGFTDSNLARPKGTKAYGLVPFEVNEELLRTMHGKHERVPVEQVKKGLQILFRAVVDAAGRP
jgi:acetylornithine deacetylase/succinyl-diaminopimelate desuccinylase-like protein